MIRTKTNYIYKKGGHKKGGRAGIEPATSRTRSENHTSRPTAHVRNPANGVSRSVPIRIHRHTGPKQKAYTPGGDRTRDPRLIRPVLYR